MPIGIILSAIFVPACVALVFSVIQKGGTEISSTMSDENFTVMIPSMVITIGAMCAFMSLAVLLGFTFLSDVRPHFILYAVFGLFFWLGTYLIVKTLTFKIIVKGERIMVFSTFRKPHSFTFDEIALAVRQIKRKQRPSERIVIKTTSGKRFIIESSEISYKRFAKKVQMEVRRECLVGFE